MHEFDLSDPDERNQAAAEYVLGTLDKRAKARFEALMAVSSDAQEEVEQWREHLDVFNTSLEPQAPSPELWKKISAETTPEKGFSFWSWQPIAAFSLVLLVTIGFFFQQGNQPENVYVHLIKNEQQQPGWVVNTALEKNQLIIQSMRPVSMPEDSFYELWFMEEGKEPITLGFLPEDGERRITIPAEWKERLMKFEIVVTMEGPNGAPNGYEMGPVSDKTNWKRIQF
ncbi:anti-sigma factor domain-containing protein [Motiliproteus sp. MSK22-1]|uniref:anti-sigma factor n=1 Tax=Motiliproteus sp. MSK22-1 TaxID=1897630 RepID=UPI000977CB45|nr:anti-sigma factor [Motiliproteus sp. MSK22-1]OMH25858.1 hypothetical protein BGP75_25430 [Motiliproteus sp. MSK22-1]